MSAARDRIFARVRAAVERRDPVEHPGRFGGWRAGTPSPRLDRFTEMFTRAGGEVLRVPDEDAAAGWLADFALAFTTMTVGTGVQPSLLPDLLRADPEHAELAVSRARGAVAETGSLLLDARDGRSTQLLCPTHVVFVHAHEVHATLRGTLDAIRDELPSAIGLHSGPSKSADIGQVMVRGVHGPARVIALLAGEPRGDTR